MRANEASQTAEYMALFRALEGTRPVRQRLFADPLAQEFLRPQLRRVVRAARLPGAGALVRWVIDRRWPGARTSAVARTRYIDDLVIGSLAEKVAQIVILGAGFDCRAYRVPGIERVRLFEVDHPDTGRSKRERIERLLGGAPEHVRFVGIDFNRQRLDDCLAAAGFHPGAQTLFIWEGVTNYLTAEAVDVTLRSIRRLAHRCRLVFTYIHRAVLDAPAAFPGMAALRRTLQKAGEQWTFGFEPDELRGYLSARGFRLVEDVGSVEYRSRYLPARPRFLRGYEFYRIAQCVSAGDA